MEVIKVSRRQIVAAQAAVELSKVTGQAVKPIVLKIANAKRKPKESIKD